MSTNSIGISSAYPKRGEQHRFGTCAQVGESPVAGVDFAQLLRVRQGETEDEVPAAPSDLRARKLVSDDSVAEPGALPVTAANIAAVDMVAVVAPVPLAAASTAKGTSDPAGASAPAPLATVVPTAATDAPAGQARKPVLRNATSAAVAVTAPGSGPVSELAVDQHVLALAVPAAPLPGATRVFQLPTSFAGTEKPVSNEPVSYPADAKPDRFAPLPSSSATLGMPGGVLPAPVVTAHPGVVQALASAAAEAAARFSGVASASGLPQKTAPRIATSTSVTVTAPAPAPAPASELAVGQHVLALAVPATPPPDATGVFQPPASFAGAEKSAATEPVSDPAEAKPDRFSPLSTSSATLGMPGGLSPEPVVDVHPGFVQDLASAAAEAAARFSEAASASGVPQKLQIDIDNGEAGRIRMDMVFSEPGHAALVVHASSEAQSQLLGERSQQLVDTLRELGLVVQVSVREGGTQGGASDGRPNPGRGMAGVAPAHAVRRTTDPMTPLSAMAPRATDGTRLDLYA